RERISARRKESMTRRRGSVARITVRKFLLLLSPVFLALALGVLPAHADPPPEKSSPADMTRYVRPKLPQEMAAAPQLLPQVFIRDPIMSNANPDQGGGGEPSIAVNPANPNQIVISAFLPAGWNG